MINGSFHGLGRLKHFGDDQFVVIEEAAHLRHAGHEGPVDDVERVHSLSAFGFEVRDQAILGALDDVVGEPLVEREIGSLFLNLGRRAAEVLGDGGYMELINSRFGSRRLLPPILSSRIKQECITMSGRSSLRPRVEQQILGQTAFFLGNTGKTLELFRVDDGEIESGLGAVIEEDGVDYFARSSRQPERDVRDTEDSFDVRDLLLDESD